MMMMMIIHLIIMIISIDQITTKNSSINRFILTSSCQRNNPQMKSSKISTLINDELFI